MTVLEEPQLPPWSQVGEKRRGHIRRVTALLDRWADATGCDPAEAQAWHDAGRWHDALRDARESELRSIVADDTLPANVLHGPAAALLLEREGERRRGVLEAIRWHSVGSVDWDRTGRALFMADFLEPGRRFMRADRAVLAAQVPRDFEGVFGRVVRLRFEWALRRGTTLLPRSLVLWESFR